MRLRLIASDWRAVRRLHAVAGRWNARQWQGHRAGTLFGKALTAARTPDGSYAVTVELRKGKATPDAERIDFRRFGVLPPARPRKPR